MSRFAPIFVVLAASLWGIDGIILRPELYNLNVPIVVFVESLIVTLILTPIFYKNFNVLRELEVGDWIAFFGVAFLGGALGTMAITKALFYVNYVNLSIVILIQKLQPVFAIILAALVLKERLGPRFFLWAGFAITGAYLMTFGFNLPILTHGDKTLYAAGYALLAAFSFGSSTVLSKKALNNVGFELGTFLRFALTTLIMLIIVILFDNFKGIGEINLYQLLIFFIIAFTTGGLAIFLYYYGLKKITASVATVCELAFPLTAVLLEFFIRDNILNLVQWLGVIVLIISIIKVTKIKFIRDKTKHPGTVQKI